MGRWEPDASGRLREAALQLYVERGFEQTTVADIAARAGLTARTFFRYFTDKREVLFAGSGQLEAHLLDALEHAPASASALDAVATALAAAADYLGGNRDYAARRQSVITTNADLRERELIKMAAWAAAMADGLGRRGVSEPAASLAAEAGVAVFRVSFDRWVGEPTDRGLVTVLAENFTALRSLTAAG